MMMTILIINNNNNINNNKLCCVNKYKANQLIDDCNSLKRLLKYRKCLRCYRHVFVTSKLHFL